MAEFDVRLWLRALGLTWYYDKFQSNGYRSFEDLTRLTSNDLRRMGVQGYRDHDDILHAVEELKGQSGRKEATKLIQDHLVSVYRLGSSIVVSVVMM